MKSMWLGILLSIFALAACPAQERPVLSLPVDCRLGEDCFIQHYVDVLPGAGEKDYRCGAAAYDDHKGTDFRLLSLKAAAKGVPVLAAAFGMVKAVRDDMEDRLIVSRQDIERVEGRECGNGVVIDHGGGWETQYCHMQRGSISVRIGQAVEPGDRLGLVGSSGNTQFAHLHLSVRRNGEVVDPFLGEAIDGHCRADGISAEDGLWHPGLAGKLTYSDAQIIQTGFAGAPVSPAQAERGEIAPPSETGGALVFYGRVMNVQKGDRFAIRATGPDGFEAVNLSQPLERKKVQYVVFAGKKRRTERWAAGRYEGRLQVIRGGQAIAEAQHVFELR